MPTTDDSVQALAGVTRVKAVTDNAYLITIDGPDRRRSGTPGQRDG